MLSMLAAAVFFSLAAVQKKHGVSWRSELVSAVMFAAASLMWCVDGVSSVISGGPFLDLSREDFVLGLIVVAAGCAVYAVLRLKSRCVRPDAAH